MENLIHSRGSHLEHYQTEAWFLYCCMVDLQVCPALSLPLIRRVLANFVPDIFSPEPISPTLLAELNSEVWVCNAPSEFGF